MFPQSILAPWARLFASLTLEVILVVALAALLARVVRSASGQRMVWRISFVVLGALVLAELSGMGHSLLRLHRLPANEPVPTHTVVVNTSPSPAEEPPLEGTWSDVAAAPTAPSRNSRNELVTTIVSWLPLLALAGLAWFGARRSFAALKLLRLGNRATSVTGSLAARVEMFRCQLGIRRRVRLRMIAGISSPIAYGIVRPTVGIPKDFSVRFTAAQQEAILAHELAHVAAFDAVWMLLADVVTALLWWHPGAWWGRRQLRAATETAADEASLLLDDGPATLAECLVTLGGLLTRSPDPGGLGMAGFRSELGRRVERLLNLRGPQPPWSGRIAWLARLVVPAALLGLALAVTAWLLPPAADAATIGEAFQRSPLGLATTALLTADKHDSPTLIYKGPQYSDEENGGPVGGKDVQRLLLQGKQLYEAGKTDEAAAKWRTALELEPGNKAALDYLSKMSRTANPASNPPIQPGGLPLAEHPSRTNRAYVYTSKARQKIYEKLNAIRLDPVKFDNIPLTQALEQVRKESKKRDPAKKGINIIISGTPETTATARPVIDPATGLPMASAAVAESDITATTVKIDPELNDITLGQLLDIFVKVADRPIRYSVEDYGVLFSLRGAENPVLHTRWYKIDPNTFLQGMKVPVLSDLPHVGKLFRGAEVSSARGDFLTVQTTMDLVSSTVRTYFQTAGVILDPPKSLIFNDRLGMLMVRATLADHEVIEQVVQQLNLVAPDASPPQDRIEEAVQAVVAGFPGANAEATAALAEPAKTPSPAPKPLPGASVDLLSAPRPELHTRWYKIDPNTVMHGLQGLVAQDSGKLKDDGKTPGKIALATIRTYFQTFGVTLDPPKSIIFKDDAGMLMVRATLEDLDLIEQAVQVLNTVPPQVHVEVKFCELPEESVKALGFDSFLGSVASDPPAAPAERPSVDSNHRNPSTNGALAPLTGILTPQQYREILRALEERGGVTFHRAFRVTTQSGRQAQVKSVEVRTIVTGLDTTNKAPVEPGKPLEYPPITEQFDLGPILDVVPYVAADGQIIQMTVIPSIKEFVGYNVDDDFSKAIWDYVAFFGVNTPPDSQLYPLPIFRLRQVVSSATVWDGQTLVLASRTVKTSVPDGHIANKLPKELTEQLSASIQRMQKSPPKTMLVFITPIIIDPAGNRVHTDADLPARTNSVPKQMRK